MVQLRVLSLYQCELSYGCKKEIIRGRTRRDFGRFARGTPGSTLTSVIRQLWFLDVQREALDGKIVTQNQFGLCWATVSLSRPRVTDSPHQNREQHRANRSTYGDKNEPKDAHAELVCCVTFLQGGVLNWKIWLCLDNPGGKVALYMPRLSKRWQFSEHHRLDDHVHATPTLINPRVFR